MTHQEADFTTLAGWQAWCRQQDGGCPNDDHDRRRAMPPSDMFGAVMLLFLPMAFWGGLSWLLFRGFW